MPKGKKFRPPFQRGGEPPQPIRNYFSCTSLICSSVTLVTLQREVLRRGVPAAGLLLCSLTEMMKNQQQSLPAKGNVIVIDQRYSRTAMLTGEDGIAKLRSARIAVFGAGGVGGHAIEALARCGVGSIDIYDDDNISVSNLNRQLLALKSTVGMNKAEAAVMRIADIDDTVKAAAHKMFFLPENADEVDFTQYDVIIDAIDTVSGKIELAVRGQAAGAYVISAMGAGNKLDPTAFTACDIYETSVCPLARVMRRELRKRGVKSLRVVYSTEEAITPLSVDIIGEENSADEPERKGTPKKNPPGSISFVPSAAGLIIASETVKYILGY